MLLPDPLTLIQVQWDDSHSEDPWTSIEELLTTKAVTIDTVGWYIGKAGKSWAIATGLDNQGNAGATWFIPECLVREWKALT